MQVGIPISSQVDDDELVCGEPGLDLSEQGIAAAAEVEQIPLCITQETAGGAVALLAFVFPAANFDLDRALHDSCGCVCRNSAASKSSRSTLMGKRSYEGG